ncbi:MAG: hypothetical protein QXG39_09850 [Candidatus Aenigmatarchaeota archaeon]
MSIVKIDAKKLEESEPQESGEPQAIKIKRVSEGYEVEGLPDYDVPVVARSTSALIDYLRRAGIPDETIEEHLSNFKAMMVGDTIEIPLENPLEEIEESEPEVIRADIKSENVQLFVEIPRKLAKKLEETANMLDTTKRSLVIEALEKHLEAINDISYLDGFPLDKNTRVDEFINYLREKGVVILTPKAIKRIREKLKDGWAITLNKNKFTEFCEKLGIDESETENPQYAFFIKWK